MISSIFSVELASVVLLVLQNTALVILMRYSRTQSGKQLYSTTTAVFNMEILKFCCCLFIILCEKRGSLYKLVREIQQEIVFKPKELLKVSVPAILFTIQNNLLYFAISRLDVVTFQAASQLKILTTALFSVVLLQKQISLMQWISCFLLAIGVTLTQVSNVSTKVSTQTVASSATEGSAFDWNQLLLQYDAFLGIFAVVCASITSGFSSVYFEKILKNSKTTSIWIRNLQMGIFSIFFAYFAMIFSDDWKQLMNEKATIYYGYNQIVILMIILQALGGLVVAIVMKYTDNIIKGFAASSSIGLSWLISALFFNYQTTWKGISGLLLIMASVFLYMISAPVPMSTTASTAVSSPNKRSILPIVSVPVSAEDENWLPAKGAGRRSPSSIAQTLSTDQNI